MDQLLVDAAKTLATGGLWGLAVAGLVYYLMLQRAEIKEVREECDIKLASKDKLILELYDRLINQANAGLRGQEAVQKTLESIADKAVGVRADVRRR